MKKWLVFIFFFFFAFHLPLHVNSAVAKSDCTEPLPDLFKRISPSVVLIRTLGIDPFKVSGRISTIPVNLSFYREGKQHKVEFILPERPILPWDLPHE